jgi:predicted CoA-binding protein
MAEDLLNKTCRVRPTSKPTVAVIGASPDPDRPSHKAVKAFADAGFEVYPVNPNATEVAGKKCYDRVASLPVDSLDRVALFVSGQLGMQVIDDLAHLAVGEIWASPGADDPAVISKARRMGISAYSLCSLEMLGAAK